MYLSVQDADRAAYLPHFGAKAGVETAIAHAGIPYTILRPINFYQNDLWLREAILQYGVYAQPIGDVGVSRVDVRDIAAVAAVALTTPGHEGETYNLVGPDAHTGQSTAEEWSRALGRPIAYAGNDLAAWEEQQRAYLPDWMVFDFSLMYDYFQRNGWQATPADLERLTAVLGHPPRSFRDFATETAASWKS
ncbi:MAG: NmrA family NAD(P)-binding protein [Gemmatimonadaceae bacterium]